MPFSPYHRFENRNRLDRLVVRYHSAGTIDLGVFDKFQRYHPAFVHKLKSAKFNIGRLEEKLTTTEIQEAANMASDFMFEVNMYIDGFFYNAGSALDILARVVLTLFGEPLNGNIYFQTAHQILNAQRAGDPILPLLTNPTWRSAFSDYRNTLTHELVLAPLYNIVIDGTNGVTPSHIIKFPLPDDPRAAPPNRSFRRNPDVLSYAKQHFKRILTIGNSVYGNIVERASSTGILPL